MTHSTLNEVSRSFVYLNMVVVYILNQANPHHVRDPLVPQGGLRSGGRKRGRKRRFPQRSQYRDSSNREVDSTEGTTTDIQRNEG
jgi:hypothetical protein